jgi:hypothetical protein
MTFNYFSWLATAGCLALLFCVPVSGCGDDVGSITGAGGSLGTGGMGGTGDCDEAAAPTCVDLLDCCRAILVNPVFFQSCNSVVLQCDEMQCQEVLDGYVQCAPEPEP